MIETTVSSLLTIKPVLQQLANTEMAARDSFTVLRMLKVIDKEYETIESDIEKLETEIVALDDEMIKNASNYGKLNALSQEKDAKEALLMEKMERWEYLEDLASQIAAQEK